MDKLALTPKETANRLGIGLNKVYELINLKSIPSIRVGRKILIPISCLENWLLTSAGDVV